MWPRLVAAEGLVDLVFHTRTLLRFNVAAARLPRKGILLSHKKPGLRGFNVAAAGCRGRGEGCKIDQHAGIASMWPRLVAAEGTSAR